MSRTILLVTASLLAGAGLTYFLQPTPERLYTVPRLQPSNNALSPGSSRFLPVKDGAPLTLTSLVDEPFGVAKQAAVYAIVGAASLDMLRDMARELWTAGRSMSVDFVLDVIFSRMTEIDRDAGIEFIREANPDAERMFVAALAVLVSSSITNANMDRIVGALPQLDKRRLTTEALKRLAQSDPEQATALVVGLHDGPLRDELLHDIAAAWFRRDPTTAQAATAGIAEHGDRVAFEAGLMSGLTLTDPEKALLDLAQNSVLTARQLDASVAAIRQLAEMDPRRALELADGLEGAMREIALTTAIRVWGSEDPYGAIGLVDRLVPGHDRDVLLQAIGEELGREDPDVALAWFNSLDNSPPGLYGSLLKGVAQSRPQRALELALLDSNDPFARAYLMSVTSTVLQSGDVSFADLAERVLATDTRQSRETGVQTLVNAASSVNDPDEILSWLVSHTESLSRHTLYQAATVLARQSPSATAQYSQLLPAEYREGWIRAVATGYGENDPARASVWLEQFRGDAIYDAGMTAIVQASAIRDPAAATALLLRFTDADARDRVATALAQQWAGREPDAAHDWASTLPAGALRDAALAGTMVSSNELPNAATLALFQSDQARQQALFDFAVRRAGNDHDFAQGLDEARGIIDRHIEDPGLRRRAEQIFESIESSSRLPPI